MRVEFLCDATREEPVRLRSLGAESISAMAMPHMSITQTLFETKEVKAQLLDGKGAAVERIHYANQSAFVVLKVIAFAQRGVNTDVVDLIHLLQYGSDLEEGARAFVAQFKQSPHRVALESSLDCLRRSFCARGDTEGHCMKGSVAHGRSHKPDNVDERLQLQLQASALLEMYVKLFQAEIDKS